MNPKRVQPLPARNFKKVAPTNDRGFTAELKEGIS